MSLVSVSMNESTRIATINTTHKAWLVTMYSDAMQIKTNEVDVKWMYIE